MKRIYRRPGGCLVLAVLMLTLGSQIAAAGAPVGFGANNAVAASAANALKEALIKLSYRF